MPGGSGNETEHGIDGKMVPAPVTGIGLIILACLCFSILDATAKYLSASLPTLQIVWVRFVSHLVLALVLFRVWRSPQLLRTDRWGLQIVRAFCLLGTTIFNFLAVRYLQLAETMSIMFAAPFVITALAGACQTDRPTGAIAMAATKPDMINMPAELSVAASFRVNRA